MDPLSLGLLSAAAPTVLDFFTGASRKQQEALDNQQNQLQQILNQINGQMGSSAADSTSYKTAMALANKAYDRQAQAAQQFGAASGQSDEAKLGTLQMLNDGYNTQQLNNLSVADQERKRLQQQADSVRMQMAGMQAQRAGQLVNSQNQATSGLMAMMPYLLSKPNPVGTTNNGAS